MKKLSVEERLGRALTKRGWDLALAESCTGGLLGFRITSVPGSSRYFRGAIVAYEDAVKRRLLGVRPATLRRHGAVSAETAVEMARGARKLLHTKAALSVTGIAGPGGGSRQKPVGLVCAAAAAGRRVRSASAHFSGSRDAIRRRASDLALNLLLATLEEDDR